MDSVIQELCNFQKPLWLQKQDNAWKVAENPDIAQVKSGTLIHIPAVDPKDLGSESFRKAHNLKYAYVAGAMAGGIGSSDIVIAMAKAGMLGFFGSGGLSLERVEQEVDRVQSELQGETYGFNLLHNPFEPKMEEATVELYLKKGVTRVSAAAYLSITPYIVHYRVRGLTRDENGQVCPKNHVFAKISRSELARAFMSPAPQDILDDLVKKGKITKEEAEMAREIPMAEDITAEADSGGHTDKRPFINLIPTMCAIREQLIKQHNYYREIRIGGAGGIATPHSVAAAFSMGADYVLTGSINQACVEAGTSDIAKEMIAKAESHDVRMAPAADMFEMGVEVQVLKFGTMFAMRGEKLYHIYKNYPSLEAIPEKDRGVIEKTIFRKSIAEVWQETEAFFQQRDPRQVEKANKDPKHKMALVFRWYLGNASRWARQGDLSRKVDYQIWCGQGMGSFNEWVRGTFLEPIKERKVVIVAHNLLRGSAIIERLNLAKIQGVKIPSSAYNIAPSPEFLA